MDVMGASVATTLQNFGDSIEDLVNAAPKSVQARNVSKASSGSARSLASAAKDHSSTLVAQPTQPSPALAPQDATTRPAATACGTDGNAMELAQMWATLCALWQQQSDAPAKTSSTSLTSVPVNTNATALCCFPRGAMYQLKHGEIVGISAKVQAASRQANSATAARTSHREQELRVARRETRLHAVEHISQAADVAKSVNELLALLARMNARGSQSK